MSENNTIDTENLTFEEAMSKLVAIAADMESGNMPLDKLISSYEQGSILVKFCRTKLAKLENRIEILSKDDGNSGEWSPFNAENNR